jgi:hypothetical protein
MKGYFSRIAKQSGLRFSRGTAKERQSTNAEPTSKHLSPIEVDQTILVAPSESGQPAKSKRLTPRSKITEEPQAPKRTGKADQPNVAPNPAALSENTEKKPEINETKFVTTSPPATVSSTHEQTASALPTEKAFVEPAVIEQTIVKAKESSFEPAPEITEPASVEVKVLKDSSQENIAHDTPEKDYFAKTAEIIERGDVEPEEIRQILFREIQQWAADSPTEAEISETVVEKTEPQVTKQIVRPSFEQTEPISEQVAEERAETNSLAEQTFELSIGTINVVIEDEKPKQPEPTPRANAQNTAQPAKREYSRLSRHYL